jgi:hypothetical protein
MRCCDSVAGKAASASPAANEGTDRACVGMPCASSAIQRDGWRSAVARRSPRGVTAAPLAFRAGERRPQLAVLFVGGEVGC